MNFFNKIMLAAGLIAALPQACVYSAPLKGVKDRAECPGGLAIYRTDKDKVLLGLPDAMLGRKLLIGGGISATSDPGAAAVGGRTSGQPLCLTAIVRDSLLVLCKPGTALELPDGESWDAVRRRNLLPAVYRRTEILSREGGRVVFDITPLVLKAAPRGSEFKPASDAKNCWFGQLKAFDDNASVKLIQSVESSGLGGRGTVSLESTVSVLVLPSEPMKARLQDSRIGTFSTGASGGGYRYELSGSSDGLRPYRLANRWRLEPSDMEAWQRGECVSVLKPIVWYIDDSFPPEWREAAKKGVLAWNDAFEEIGFKEVLQVRDFPSDDPCFDPENLAVNCVRFVPNKTANSMGPSWADPDTGEIVNASVLIYSEVAQLLNQWRFVQTAQVDERVRNSKLSEELIAESLEYVVAHEIGHTLGLLHNMAASAAIPVDSLRSPSFTAIHGTTASIMDYARFNYVAQPSDGGVRLVPPKLGVYDRYAIAWLYTPQPDAADIWEDSALSGKLIDAHEGDPFYRYGPQQPSMAIVQTDPTARTQDLGDDPIKAGDYGISNLRIVLGHLNEWIEDDEDYSHRSGLYQQICRQYSRYLANGAALVGGVKLNRSKTLPPTESIPESVQRKALGWVIDRACESSWLDEPEVTAQLGLHASEADKAVVSVARYLAQAAPAAVLTASVNGSEYTPAHYFSDLRTFLFPSGRTNACARTLQRTFLESVVRQQGQQAQSPKSSGASLEDEEYCFGEAVAQIPSVPDMSASNDLAVYRKTFLDSLPRLLRRRARSAASAQERAHYNYLYSLLQ